MTYSIVARDKVTGFLGVAVQSHYFSVGPVVPWARSGVGAVATQSMVDIKYGPLGLDLMSGSKNASEALESLLEADSKADSRQVGMVDANGIAAAHTGSRCIDFAGHVTGDGFACQANLMSNNTVWVEMKKAYERNPNLEFPERLLATLEAAENAGGDARGRQSAAILIVSPQIYPNQWMGRLMELRVEDNPNPLKELSRLIRLKRSYDLADKGDDLLTSGKVREAGEAYARALELAPDNEEILYWKGVTYLGSSLKEEGASILKSVFRTNKNWVMITKSLLRNGLIVKSKEIDDLIGTE